MSQAVIVHLSSELLWLVLLLSAPIVVVASVVGVVISLVQALTQIQDQTIQFLLKLLAASLTLVMTYHWMGDVLMSYTIRSFEQISRMH